MAGIEKDQFTDSTNKLLSRLQTTLIKFIAVKKGQLELYKELGNRDLIDLSEGQLIQLKADLEQLRNL